MNEEMPRMPPASPLKILVVDDEAPARRRLVDLLARVDGVGEVLEAGDGAAAVRMIAEHRPAAVFLDMQMPGPSGLDVVGTVGAGRMPVTVFVTAYDQYAVRAFEASALDYLLKPFSDERFEAAMRRVLARLEEHRPAEEPPRWDRLVVKTAGATHIVKTTDIDWIEAVGVYVNLYVGGKALLYRSPIHVLADKLDPAHFVRIHRSAIVNLESILRLEPLSHGEFDVVLKHGGRTKVSRTYRGQLEQRLGQAL
ncbi:LytR/AlgR family response regulator transcription factor [Massilia sp. CT11-108]|uniref:LytR/AlgR family response regulator transcription factor n=1 Tax=Massilia sp. CT11-108 TaxID=3393900 RepID=UPI0039A5E8D8